MLAIIHPCYIVHKYIFLSFLLTFAFGIGCMHVGDLYLFFYFVVGWGGRGVSILESIFVQLHPGNLQEDRNNLGKINAERLSLSLGLLKAS